MHPRFWCEGCLSFKLSVVNHSIIEFSFSRVHSGTFFIVLRDFWQRRDQVNKFILLYAWCDNHRGWLASIVPLQFGRFSGLPSLLVIQNWQFSSAWSSCVASVVPWTATFSCPEYNIDSGFSITVSCSCKVSATGPVFRPLHENCLVEEELNGGFGALPVWCLVYHCQTAQQNARKTLRYLKKKKKKPERCNLVTYSWCSASGLFSLLPVVGTKHRDCIVRLWRFGTLQALVHRVLKDGNFDIPA